nr:DUF935 family protein [uncultured Porphyromonas sp.]DAR78391.1 MAG TPA: portal [Caudoviricetes sp.]DAU53990.1 MAG TPA: portal [Caudoviricetes sp.]
MARHNSNDNDKLLQLAKSIQARRIAAEITRKTDALTQKDIASWRRAWQMAINVESPRRAYLYDLYADSLVDGHLTGCIEQRKSKTLGRPFRLLNAEGEENTEATALLEREWFYDFLSIALDSIFWGHSLIEMGEVIRDDKGLRFDSATLIPRKHVVPEYGVLLRDPSDDIPQGIPYRSGDYARWLVEVGKPYDLGLLLRCAPYYISKKNMGAFWDTFGEIFGMPMRIANTSATNKADIARIEEVMDNMGAAFWGVFPEDTKISFQESSRGDAYNVYDKRLERCDKEISKILLSQTMTIDNGSSLSQSEVHLEIFDHICASDAKRIGYIINDRLLPLMVSSGFPVKGLTFAWDYSDEMTEAEMREQERVILQYYDIDPEYFVRKYNVPIVGKRTGGPELGEQGSSNDDNAEEGGKTLAKDSDFFA